MTKHYAKTETIRAGVSQEARIVYRADGPTGSYCQVQVIVPSEPGVLMWVDEDPAAIGPNRVYKGAPCIPSFQRADLLPGQFLVLATEDGFAPCSLIVHHLWES